MPMFQITPPDPEAGQKESQVQAVELGGVRQTEAERVAQAMRQRTNQREAERYGNLVAQPHPQESIVITEETRKRLEQERMEKASVPNVVTTHSDVAKVAAGSDVALVPTVSVYTHDNPLEQENTMKVEDRTVTLHGTPVGETTLDRAESSLAQPVGDEYSARSATGPTLPEGKVLQSIQAEEKTEPAFSPEDSPSDRLEQIQSNAEQAGADAAKVVERQSQAVAEDAKRAESRGATGIAGEKSTDENSGSPATGAAVKTAAPKTTAAKTSSSKKGKGK